MTNTVIESIKTRRSVRKVKEAEAPPREQIEQIIEAAIWAPNHYLTEPWRFVVIRNEERLKLGEALAGALSKTLDPADTEKEKKLDVEKSKALRAPIMIALISNPKQGENIIQQEEIVAAGAALQNMLLAAHSLGLGATIRTGKTAYSEEVRQYFNMKENEKLVALVCLGYASEPLPSGRRTGYKDKTEWRGF